MTEMKMDHSWMLSLLLLSSVSEVKCSNLLYILTGLMFCHVAVDGKEKETVFVVRNSAFYEPHFFYHVYVCFV